MTRDWIATKWGNLAALEYGKSLRDYRERDTGFRVFGTNGPIGWHETPIATGPGVIIGRKGAYRGVHYSPSPFSVIDTAYYLKPHPDVEFDMLWAYFQLRTIDINRLDTGAAIPSLSREVFYEIPVVLPPLETQRLIASILGTYDDLIEVNRRRIVVLEEMARRLFEEWFVRFRFPGHEQIALAGSKPHDWSLVKVGTVLRKFRRPAKVKKQAYERDGVIPCIDQGADFVGGYTNNADALITSPLPLCVFGDHTRALKFVTFPFASGADGTQLLYPVDDLTPEFLYFSLLNVDLSNQHYARHFKFLKEQEILLPTKELIERFTRVAKPQMELVENIRLQSQKLATSRDLLLPRLISGQLSVAEAERQLGKAA